MSESLEETEARHRKELKALDGEKRSAIKKAKGTKGKKAKDEVAGLEAEFEAILKEMKQRHEIELQVASGGGSGSGTEAPQIEVEPDSEKDGVHTIEDEQERNRRMEKSRKKREKAREKEREREQRIAQETANAGPAARDVENEIIQQQLSPLKLCMHEVVADGHCLYRAVAAHCGTEYTEMRRQCAEIMSAHEEDFAPFCVFTDDAPDFQAYVNRVLSSADWGGHLELRALSMALKRPILVYSAQNREPILIEEQGCDSSDPIRLSFHLNYYALGEHYNQVIPVEVNE